MPPLIVITPGDVTGIGPEVTAKALASELGADDTSYLIVGDPAPVRRWNESLGLGLPFRPLSTDPAPRSVFLMEPSGPALPVALSPGAPEAAQAAMRGLEDAAGRCLRHEADALVTGPVSKESIIRAGWPDFVGQTEHLARLAGTARPVMMLLGPDERGRWLRVALATTHLPLKRVAAELSFEKVSAAIEQAARACQQLSLPRARVGVCGLNPHAGEGGRLGDEELTLIRPAVDAARQRGVEASGPHAADSLFHRALRGDFEVVVAMYHDQGLAPLKMVAFEQGVNWTLGLPFIRVSPDHGTAYDIAGRGVAEGSSMAAAIRLARQLVRGRPRTRP